VYYRGQALLLRRHWRTGASPTGTGPVAQLGQPYGAVGGHRPCFMRSSLQMEHQCLSWGPLLGSTALPQSPKWQSGQGIVQVSHWDRCAPTERDRGRRVSTLRRRAPRGLSVCSERITLGRGGEAISPLGACMATKGRLGSSTCMGGGWLPLKAGPGVGAREALPRRKILATFGSCCWGLTELGT
jgi:hypothetical protein